jgi:hypothetical protein
MSVCFYCVCIVLYVGLIPRTRSPADSVWDQETEKATKPNKRVVEPIIIMIIDLVTVPALITCCESDENVKETSYIILRSEFWKC